MAELKKTPDGWYSKELNAAYDIADGAMSVADYIEPGWGDRFEAAMIAADEEYAELKRQRDAAIKALRLARHELVGLDQPEDSDLIRNIDLHIRAAAAKDGD